jgi:hypothetical protein
MQLLQAPMMPSIAPLIEGQACGLASASRAGALPNSQPSKGLTVNNPLRDAAELAKARAVIQKHYSLREPVCNADAVAEVRNVIRKALKGSLDDCGEHLRASLETALQRDLI